MHGPVNVRLVFVSCNSCQHCTVTRSVWVLRLLKSARILSSRSDSTLLLLYDMDVSVTGLFFPVLLLNQRWSPLRLQASHCSTFRIVCDVPSIAVFCSESIECFPGTVSKFFLKLLVTVPVAPIITGTIVQFRFHICCISIHRLSYYYCYKH